MEVKSATSVLVRSLSSYADRHRLGLVGVGCDFLLARDPDLVRVADIAFLSRDQVKATMPAQHTWPGAPSLAVKVITLTDTYMDVADWVADWLEHGTRQVFVVNPCGRRVAVHGDGRTVVTLAEDIALDGGDVIPGWTLPLRDLFR
jgi:Uma2 family endonuclease